MGPDKANENEYPPSRSGGKKLFLTIDPAMERPGVARAHDSTRDIGGTGPEDMPDGSGLKNRGAWLWIFSGFFLSRANLTASECGTVSILNFRRISTLCQVLYCGPKSKVYQYQMHGSTILYSVFLCVFLRNIAKHNEFEG